MNANNLRSGDLQLMKPVFTSPISGGVAFDLLPMPAYIKNTALVFTHANPAYCELLGCSADAVVGHTSKEVNPLDWMWHEDTDRKVLAEGGVETHELNLRRPGRPAMRAEIFKIRLDDADGRPVGILGVIVDRTRRFESEQRLLESQAAHEMVFESISDAVFMLNGAGQFTFVGPNVETIFGMDRAAIYARGTVERVFGNCDGDLAGLPRDHETRNMECCTVRPDGERRDLLVNVKPIEIGDSRWLLTCRDVTERVQAANRLKASMMQTVAALCATVEKRDPYVIGHQDRVAELAVAIGRRMGLDPDRLEGLRLASIVHDIGKITVPAEILSKPGRLSEPEFDIIKSHVETGYEILKDIEFPWPIARIVREHHEAIDGSGYPRGLTGEQLLLESRILSVADVLEAVTSSRPYRPGLGLDSGIAILREMRGLKLDPDVVDACLGLLDTGELSVAGWVESAAEPVRG